MTRHTLTRITTVGLVTGFAGLAMAVPAEAREIPDGGGPTNTTVLFEDKVEPGTPWMEIGIGALGGLALAGAGVAAAQSVRNRQAVPTH